MISPASSLELWAIAGDVAAWPLLAKNRILEGIHPSSRNGFSCLYDCCANSSVVGVLPAIVAAAVSLSVAAVATVITVVAAVFLDDVAATYRYVAPVITDEVAAALFQAVVAAVVPDDVAAAAEEFAAVALAIPAADVAVAPDIAVDMLLLSADVAARLAGELINLGLCRFQVFAAAAPLLREQKT